MLIFTPGLPTASGSALEALRAALPHVDVLQVRAKSPSSPDAPSQAREVAVWTRQVLELLDEHDGPRPLVLVNDRVDVAAALAAEGCDGVHVGADDCAPAHARSVLGEAALIGLSTHSAGEVASADDGLLDYLGFGPVNATSTKGYDRGLGPEAAWVADQASALPLFPIGGIDLTNVGELAQIGRAAVGAGITAASDPAAAAQALRAAL